MPDASHRDSSQCGIKKTWEDRMAKMLSILNRRTAATVCRLTAGKAKANQEHRSHGICKSEAPGVTGFEHRERQRKHTFRNVNRMSTK
jgi:hypothetical protein